MKARLLVLALAVAAFGAWFVVPAGAQTAVPKPAPSAGCGSGAAKHGDAQINTKSGGKKRFYFRFIPRGYDGKTPTPMVLDLHGSQEPAGLHKINSGLGPYGDKHGFITVTPQGSPGPPVQWDTHVGSADMKFILHVLDDVQQKFCIDRRRIFVTGYSNGAMVTSVMACNFADRIAAVAPVAGIRNVPGCAPSRPVPVVAFHGVADEWLAFNGGLGPGPYRLPPDQTQALIDIEKPTDSGQSIPDITAAWAARNGCTPPPAQSQVAADVTLVTYTCPNGADVELFEIAGGGHTWPGSKYSKAIEQYVGPTTFSISADVEMWKFFQQHPLRGPLPKQKVGS